MTIHKFPEINLLKTKFHKLTVQDLIKYIVTAGMIDKKTIIAHINVRGMNFAYQLPWYRNFMNNADLVFCDGIGVILGARILGYDLEYKHRMTAPDYIENLALACEQNNVSLFLLAGEPGVTDKAIKKFKAITPNLSVEGHHGYFDKNGSENDAVIEKINQFKPDILYIGFGMPLQEKWILDNFNKIETRVFLPLGACLDFYTNTVYRGPRWLTDNGFEWLTRLITEPTRLWERYVVGNPLFFYRIFKQRINQRLIANKSEKL
ncbi:WecB/TagA/CpsF family glycosyl transferase [Calothrix brevissima NIES-22]|nr:WecB/TagA/CpsF family glycosyl transferase [Calothrix brevissima NIES-22]